MNVALFCIPGNSEITPQGQHKFAHLCDGTIDIVLVKDAPRKDFIRHLRRIGNHKNQVLNSSFFAECNFPPAFL